MITLLPVAGLPEVRPGDDLAALVAAAVDLRDGDVVVVAHKVVSKAEGAVVAVPPGTDRAALRDRLVREHAVRVLVESPWTVVVQTAHGLVCAQAGVDASNVDDGHLVLLPADPDASAVALRAAWASAPGVDVGVVVTDTFGRPWRVGQTDVAIGVAGLPPVRDERGGADRFGATLSVTEVALADEVAAAADLVRRKADGLPVVVVRGLDWDPDPAASAGRLQRDAATDLFPRGRGMLGRILAGHLTDGVALRPAADDDLDAVEAAARGLASTAGTAVITSREGPVLEVTGDATAAGVAAGAAVAAAVDLGLEASWSPTTGGARVVVAGAERTHDRSR